MKLIMENQNLFINIENLVVIHHYNNELAHLKRKSIQLAPIEPISCRSLRRQIKATAGNGFSNCTRPFATNKTVKDFSTALRFAQNDSFPTVIEVTEDASTSSAWQGGYV